MVCPNASSAALEEFKRINLLASDRGRDAFGIVEYDNGEKRLIKGIGMLTAEAMTTLVPSKVIIANNRAEPTTEYVAKKSAEDIHPFEYDGVYVVHNGTIANDQDLRKQYLINTKSKIDSSILPNLFRKFGVPNGLGKVIGSYALAVFDEQDPNSLWLACNYKPLWLKKTDNALYFTSLEEYLRTGPFDRIFQMKPYSLIRIDTNTMEIVSEESLLPEVPKKVLVICSGGLDSVVTATHYVRQGIQTGLLHFQYGCRAEKKELEAVKAVGAKLNIPVIIVPMSSLYKDIIKGSRLTNTKDNLMLERSGEASAELAWEWVPARNLVMFAIAAAIAESHGYTVLAQGTNLEESGAYPDNEMQFVINLNKVMPYAVNLNHSVTIEQPIGNLMKHEIVKYGLELNAPLDLCWSCYESGDIHCGICGPCYMRRKAFKMLGKDDMIAYAREGIGSLSHSEHFNVCRNEIEEEQDNHQGSTRGNRHVAVVLPPKGREHEGETNEN
jgi:7-cyano-7-deazaguanine synthase